MHHTSLRIALGDIVMRYVLFVVAGYAALASLLWVGGFAFILRQLWAAPRICDVGAPDPDAFPSLSVLVPARNEAGSIEPALRSLLEQDYPNMEVIAIDDRSTDGTGAIIDRLGEEYDRLRPLHIDHLPGGWVGKTHALKQGYDVSRGEWVLMTDADVCYEAGALRTLMAVALHDGLDQMSCLPEVQTSGFWHEVVHNGWFIAAIGAQNLRGVSDPSSDDYFALGAFNLVRRAVFDQTKGFSWLRMEIADDMGTAKMMQNQGARQGFYLALDELSIEWYPSLGAMIKGVEKNGIAVLAHFNYLRGFFIPLLWALVFAGPIVGLFMPWTAVQGGAAVAIGSSVPFNALAARRLQRPTGAFLLSLVGVGCMMYALVRSTYACLRRGGVEWRGTTYPVKKLRRQQRVRF